MVLWLFLGRKVDGKGVQLILLQKHHNKNTTTIPISLTQHTPYGA